MNQSYEVRITSQAYSDLDGILGYIAQHSPQNAVRIVDRLLGSIQALDQFPNRYKVAPGSRRLDKAVRSMPVPPYKVVYRIDEESKVIRILTVRHGARRD